MSELMIPFFTRNAVIPCETGVFANARNGHRLSYNSETMSWELYKGEKTKFLKKHTLKPYYVTNRYITTEKLYFEVYCAKDITKKGLMWRKIYEAELSTKSRHYIEKGSKDLKYWVFGEGKSLIDNSLVDVFTDDECLKMCIKYLWKLNTIETLMLLSQVSSFSDFISWWISTAVPISNCADSFKKRKFGVEIEFTGTTRYKAAKVIAEELNGNVERHSKRRVNYKIKDSRGRIWKIICDTSIESVNSNGGSASESYKCELVTPICSYDDIETIQRIIRKLRGIGMVVNGTCGIHIHVDFDKSNARGIRNLLNLMGYCEKALYSQLKVSVWREMKWCRYTNEKFIENVNEINHISSRKIMNQWYDNTLERVYFHYDSSRYTGLNLHSLWQDKGVEFRLFNSTTHAGKVKAYIQFCLALSDFACKNMELVLTNSYHKASFSEFAELCKVIGLNGNEFKTARIHLLNEEKTKSKRNLSEVA